MHIASTLVLCVHQHRGMAVEGTAVQGHGSTGTWQYRGTAVAGCQQMHCVLACPFRYAYDLQVLQSTRASSTTPEASSVSGGSGKLINVSLFKLGGRHCWAAYYSQETVEGCVLIHKEVWVCRTAACSARQITEKQQMQTAPMRPLCRQPIK